MTSDAEQQATTAGKSPTTGTYVHSCSAGKQSTEFTTNLPKLMRETYQHYGARGPEPAREARIRVEAFITNHQTCGDLVFEKRVPAALITKDFLVALHTEVTALWGTLESHTDSITATSSCVIGDDRMYVFAVTPIRIRGFFRRNRHRANIFELVDASGFMHIAVENI
ncbi:hypothetical protein [Rhodococcus baikonurensis]|uniref:SnoaL-like domain-containing protein n=1 Tax=Rhodococcus baikonurensis TaxID=172041 RepID=A0ABV5XM87_9NOCA